MAENLTPQEPELKDLLDLFRKNLLLGFNCHHIGAVQSFNSAKQTATATINYKKTFLKPDSTGVYKTTLEDYPTLIDCPVVVLGGGGASLTFPVAKGDECLVLFNDRDFDAWFQGNTGAAVPTSRLHSFADGIILVGIRSLPNVLKTYDTVRAVLSLGQATVGVGGGGGTKVLIGNNTTTLNTLLQSLLTDLLTLTDPLAGAAFQFGVLATAASGPLAPLKPGFLALQVLFGTANTSFNALTSQMSGLLE